VGEKKLKFFPSVADNRNAKESQGFDPEVAWMTISTYHVNNVLKAYTKQNRTKINVSGSQEQAADNLSRDVVSLSVKETKTEEAFTKISYTLLDAIVKKPQK
jgi:hypothetical protein